MIRGVIVAPLLRIPDDRGDVLRMIRADTEGFRGFGEIYFSLIHCGAVKAWRRHRELTMNCAVPVGQARFVLFDDRADSPTRGEMMDIVVGIDNYVLVTIPPGVWNGMQGLSAEPAVIANCADFVHRPDEVERLATAAPEIPYRWGERQS